jgi:septation ring formation regulator EzrA
MSSEVMAAIIGLIGVIIGAIPTFLFMRKRNAAEIDKLQAETDKIKAGPEKIHSVAVTT